MQTRLILKVLGFLLIIFSVSLLPPLLIGWFDADGTHLVFLQAWVGLLLVGVSMWLPNRSISDELRIRDGFLMLFCSGSFLHFPVRCLLCCQKILICQL